MGKGVVTLTAILLLVGGVIGAVVGLVANPIVLVCSIFFVVCGTTLLISLGISRKNPDTGFAVAIGAILVAAIFAYLLSYQI